MSKAILVIDMPSCCYECFALDDNGDYPRCRITDEQRGYKFKTREQKMDKCPLKPVPEKIDVPAWDDNIKAKNENAEEVGMYMYDRGHYRGYNLCIDKITRGRRLDCSLYEDYCDLPQEIINEVCKPFIINKE